jgi:Fe-S cluster biogenesis protein NfuA
MTIGSGWDMREGSQKVGKALNDLAIQVQRSIANQMEEPMIAHDRGDLERAICKAADVIRQDSHTCSGCGAKSETTCCCKQVLSMIMARVMKGESLSAAFQSVQESRESGRLQPLGGRHV